MTIKVKDLSVQYENKIIFYNTELEIPNNKLTMLIGANGTGKTTLFKIITKNIEIKNINI
ncbi:ATP-binding cassette domain-containing protein, partial [bacterium]|nr:ATP-binding cassette domain-containing protein [bacterium]